MQHSFYSDSIDLNIDVDASSRLPLMAEKDKIRDLILNFLPLPYSIAEYGCGKKSSLIIQKLIELGIPPYAIQRGMIMERDMSPEALAEPDFNQRPHALSVFNRFYYTFDPQNEVLLNRLQRQGIQVLRDDRSQTVQLVAGDYTLSHDKTLQFVMARSHIFVILAFFDHRYSRVSFSVIDPTIEREDLFGIAQMRTYLHAPESLIFTAPLFGRFRLQEDYMTESQRRFVYHRMLDHPLNRLSEEEHFELIRAMNGAAPGTIGDPATWTYENNIPAEDAEQQERLAALTGSGDFFRYQFAEMIEARCQGREEDVVELAAQMQAMSTRLDLTEQIRLDSLWSETKLEPLKRVVNLVADQVAAEELNTRISTSISLQKSITTKRGLTSLFGIGFRLRERLEEMARVSRNSAGQISAQAFTEEYCRAARSLIAQMNQAGLRVCIDTVGNIHGLLIDDETAETILKDPQNLAQVVAKAITMGSHIDTVADGGKYDGRLGVLSGIEVAELLRDMHHYYGIATVYPAVPRTMIVSAYVGEEMSFTGQGVSMPGSSAVAGLAEPEHIYRMTNQDGHTYGQRLQFMLQFLKEAEERNEIHTLNRLKDHSPEELLSTCFNPRSFYSPHSYERHIEQGSRLHEAGVPMVLVNTIMGIYQEDFTFEGEQAEEATLDCIAFIRDLALRPEYAAMRMTVGMLSVEDQVPVELDYGMRFHLIGRKGHAGGAAIAERSDAGVAASRLYHFFRDLQSSFEERVGSVEWIAGAPAILPGTNRNVIPGESILTLGLRGDLSSEDQRFLLGQLQGFVVGNLSLDVNSGGEGLLGHSVQEVSLLNRARKVRFSIDIRYAEEQDLQAVLEELQACFDRCSQQYDIKTGRNLEQRLRPYKLTESGQALQMERSYGGSHNPLETELARDVLRGTLLQLAVTLDFLRLDRDREVNLYRFVHERMPDAWKKAIPSFVSAALHDTCNIAAAGQKS